MNPILRSLALLSVSALIASFAIAQPRSGGRPSEMNMKLMQPIMTAAMADRDALAKLKLTPKEQAAVRKIDEEMGKAIQKQFPDMSRSMSDADQKKMVTAVLNQMKARREKLKTVLGPARFAQYSKFYATAEKNPNFRSSSTPFGSESERKELQKRVEIYQRVEKELSKKHLSQSQVIEKALTKAGASAKQKAQVKQIFASSSAKRMKMFDERMPSGEMTQQQRENRSKAFSDKAKKISAEEEAQLKSTLGPEKLKIFKEEQRRINGVQSSERAARIAAEEKKAGLKPTGGRMGMMGRPGGSPRPGSPR